MGEGQRQHEPMEATTLMENHGHQPQHRYISPGRRGNVGLHHQPYLRDFFQPQVPPAQSVQHGLQNQPAQLCNRDQLIDLVQETYGPALRPLVCPAYMKPYPNIIDHENPFPRGFKVLEFTLFSGEVVSMADLSRLAQKPGESFEAFLARFRRARLKCRVALPEQEFFKLAQNGLDIKLRKKFEGMEFRDFYELSYKVAQYENLLKEDVQKKAASHGTHYSDPNFDLDVAEVVTDKPVVCPNLVRPTHQPETSLRGYVGEVGKQYTFDMSKTSDIFNHLKKSGLIKLLPGHKISTATEIGARDYCKFHNSWKHSTDNCLIFHNVLQEKIDKGILKFPDKAKETMGVDADPFPVVSVGVNVVYLRSVARNCSLPYAQRNLAAEYLRWVIEVQRSKHSRNIRSNQQRLGGQGKSIVTKNFSLEGARRHSTGTKSSRMVKPPLRLQRKRVKERKRQQKQVEAWGSSSRRPRQPTKRNVVWVRKEKNNTVIQTLLKGDDQSPASPKVASAIVSQDEVLKATFEAQEQSGNRGAESKEDGTIRFGEFSVNLSCLVLTLPLVFQAKKEEEPIVFNVLPTCMLYNIGKSLDDLVHTEVTISDFTEGVNCSRGVLPVELTMGNKTLMSAFFVVNTIATYNALLGRDWIHSSWCVPSTFHQKLIFRNCGKAEVVSADDKPFSANTHLVEARYYEDIGAIWFFGMDRHEKPIGITACSRPSLSKRVVEEVCDELLRSEIVHEGEEADQGDEITLEGLDLALAKLDDLKAEVQDPLEEINLGSEKMLGLDQKLVEHKLPIAEGFRPYKQPSRRMFAEVILKVKEEIERLVKAGFIRTSRYAEWLSNVVPVLKKNRKLRVCVEFRNLNLATPKDEYPMPIVDLLVNGVAHHKILSFMDGHSGYNQIFIVDANVPKTTFRCPSAIGTFEWVVMPFGLKNARATYQKAMNAIFHDMIGKFMEIYIDDVVVKSNGEADHLVHLRKSFERMRQHGLKMNPLKCAFGVSANNFLGYLVHERGLEVDKNKARAMIEAKPPQNKEFTETMSGAGVMVISPSRLKTQISFQLDFDCTNNQAEYEVLIIGLEMLVELKISMVEVIRDSQLVLKQLSGEYKYTSLALAPYFALTVQLLEEFDDVSIRHVPRDQNYEANEMAQIASGLQILEGVMQKVAGIKMHWLIRRHGFFWPSILKDCIAYAKGCKSCQIHGPLQRVPTSELNSIVKPWPFRGWAIDLIGKVYPPSSKGHSFIIVTTNYFTKWVEAKPMKKVNQSDAIKFIKEDIIHRSSTKMTPFALTYGHDAVLPIELTVRSLRIEIQHNLQFGEYDESMMLELEDLKDTRLAALDRLQPQKLKIAKSYNKRVKGKNLAIGDLVWKAILPLVKKDHRFGKWSPNWEGPFQIHEVLKGGAY
ncbi:hypothetical protein SLEP1_g38818 [Rubroshorea leprosula]|uniref:RNase H type-1 domain-containing protein n=1 Tax=Rubroshorea leprosula TaxID=152421 RepID=A0AAV5KYL3_9ROSI|nr:hypothetical protein SLEP1_g38818 [Rubroshorea leprosula]